VAVTPVVAALSAVPSASGKGGVVWVVIQLLSLLGEEPVAVVVVHVVRVGIQPLSLPVKPVATVVVHMVRVSSDTGCDMSSATAACGGGCSGRYYSVRVTVASVVDATV
jgi:UDP-N-acetylmuramyl tripeptide synthase